jgi:hypothetical protein
LQGGRRWNFKPCSEDEGNFRKGQVVLDHCPLVEFTSSLKHFLIDFNSTPRQVVAELKVASFQDITNIKLVDSGIKEIHFGEEVVDEIQIAQKIVSLVAINDNDWLGLLFKQLLNMCKPSLGCGSKSYCFA